jgi:hypothetical protein
MTTALEIYLVVLPDMVTPADGTERLDEFVDGPSGDSVDIGLHDRGVEGLVDAAAGFEGKKLLLDSILFGAGDGPVD